MTYSKHNKTGLTKAMKSALKEIVGERFTYLRRQKLKRGSIYYFLCKCFAHSKRANTEI